MFLCFFFSMWTCIHSEFKAKREFILVVSGSPKNGSHLIKLDITDDFLLLHNLPCSDRRVDRRVAVPL